jgi:hypothetical protein
MVESQALCFATSERHYIYLADPPGKVRSHKRDRSSIGGECWLNIHILFRGRRQRPGFGVSEGKKYDLRKTLLTGL